MVNDYTHISYGGEPENKGKKPKASSISFIRQFARVYSATQGVEFSYLILN